MPINVVVWAIVLVLFFAIYVGAVEYLVPLSVKADMNTACWGTLQDMQIEGGLTNSLKTELAEKLQNIRLTNITVNGTPQAPLGQDLYLDVSAEYKSNAMVVFLFRTEETKPMEYHKVTKSRRVVN